MLRLAESSKRIIRLALEGTAAEIVERSSSSPAVQWLKPTTQKESKPNTVMCFALEGNN